jgi:hypothetical protein
VGFYACTIKDTHSLAPLSMLSCAVPCLVVDLNSNVKTTCMSNSISNLIPDLKHRNRHGQ